MTLPQASGGSGKLTYSLAPSLPEGLQFDASARTLSGTPTALHDSTLYTYTVEDEQGYTAYLTFHITVTSELAPTFAGVTVADQYFKQGEPIDLLTLPEASGERGAWFTH